MMLNLRSLPHAGLLAALNIAALSPNVTVQSRPVCVRASLGSYTAQR